jgi:putative transposase
MEYRLANQKTSMGWLRMSPSRSTPFFGSRRMAEKLSTDELSVNRKRAKRLMRLMGIEAIYQKPRTSEPNKEHKKYPYLLKGMTIDRPGQVSTADITYIPMSRGFLYLVAIVDWSSRFILGWRLSNTIDSTFCVEALKESLSYGLPEIFNTDQGSQFTSEDFTDVLEASKIAISIKERLREGVARWTSNYQVLFLRTNGGCCCHVFLPTCAVVQNRLFMRRNRSAIRTSEHGAT